MKEVLKQIDELAETATSSELGFAIKFLANKIDFLTIMKEVKDEKEDDASKEKESESWKGKILAS